MKPIHLIINAWGPYKGKETVDFQTLTDQGVFLITGPTGAGKTTIFDAITFALFGEVSGSIREKEGVRSDFAELEDSTYVILKFSHRGEEYEIERNPKYFRPKKRGDGMIAVKENAVLRSGERVLAEGSREVTAKMEELLALNYKQFTQISMLAQGEFQKLLTTTGSERTKVFRNLFHTEVCEKLQIALTDKSRRLHESLKENQARVGEIITTVICDEEKWRELAENATVNMEPAEIFLEQDLEKMKVKWEQAKKEYEACTAVIKECIKWKEEAKYQMDLKGKKGEAEKKLSLLEEKREVYETQKKDLEIVEKAQKLLLIEAEYIRNKTAENKSEKECEQLALQEKDGEIIWKQWEERFQKNPEKRQKIAQLEESIRNVAEKKKYEKELKCAKSELEKSQQEFLRNQKEKQEKKELYEQAEKKYKMATAGLLAKDLEENKPCPVCGSLVHPNKAELSQEVPNKEYIERLKENYEKSLEKENESHSKAVASNSKIQMILASMEGINVPEEGKELEESEKVMKKEIDSLVKEVEQVETNYHQVTLKYKNVCNLHKVKLQEWKEQKNATKTSEKQYKQALSEHGFTSEEEFQLVKDKSAKKTWYEKEVKEYEEAFLLYQERRTNAENELKKRKPVDFTEVSEKLKTAEEKEAELRIVLTELQSCYKNNKRALESMKEKNEILQKLTKEYGKVSRIENITKGRNSRNLVFEQYVLSCYFDKILQAANQRLDYMTSGRYLLKRVEQAGDARSRDSLYMEVFDAYTGKTRGVQSLSGGESFKTALSLALGMSDMIQALSGGIVVETLFVDEGFGSLDDESLEQAVEVLTNLAKQQYTIGIISHVKELKEKVDRQLYVEKCRTGSRIVS